MSLGSYPQNTVAAEISKYMGNAVSISNIWGALVYNVKAPPYNAKGDGVTDDTAAIQAAFTDAAPNGLVVAPKGIYKITAQLNITSHFDARNATFVTAGAVDSASTIIPGVFNISSGKDVWLPTLIKAGVTTNGYDRQDNIIGINGMKIGTDTPLKIGGINNAGPDAFSSIKGTLSVESPDGEVTLKNTATTHDYIRANVLSLYHGNTIGSCAMRFLRQSDGSETGAVGYQNGSTGFYLEGASFLAASQPYINGLTSNSLPPSKLILGQEGAYNGAYTTSARFLADTDWSMKFQTPTGQAQLTMRTDGTVAVGTSATTDGVTGQKPFSVLGNNNGEMDLLVKNDSTNASASVQLALQVGGTGGSVGVVAAYPSTWTFGAYPANGAALLSFGAGGTAVLATHASGIIKFVTGGDQATNERMRITSSGNVGINTTSPTSKLHVSGLSVFANNAAAIAGGLTSGAFYRTGGDPDQVCVVH
jgi:hypothetical protein